ncbi:BnaC07g13540D [Brassica napus]|uniref:BnaC07g13540D protein n=1 Tax=Brassica napus TaxID=3708 RepID=A0A078FHS2_BRANA|nr:BnaC07g13540D [Brassica napus]
MTRLVGDVVGAKRAANYGYKAKP